MSDYEPTINRSGARVGAAQIDQGLRAYMNKIYSLMGIALVITGLVSYGVGSNEALVQQIWFSGGLLKYAVMFAPLAFVLVISFGINKMSAATANLVFYAFAAVMGLSMGYIFQVFTTGSIAQTFFVTAIAFLGLSLYGYTTKRSLSGMGSFLMMGLIGIIVASVLNIFMQSSALQFAISVGGVLIFAGLTAYDTQRLKNTYLQAAQAGAAGSEWLAKGAIMGALSLYLNFVNMFMFLLQFLGNRE